MFDPLESAPTVLNAEGLIKIYGNRRVVDGVSFHVSKGEIVGLLGPNGAGKTTSFRMVCGLISTNGGEVCLGNQNVTDWPMYRRSRDGGMGYLPQDRSVFQKLSVQNNLLGVMEMLHMKSALRKQRAEELLEKFNLTHLRHSYGGSLSGGERRRLEIARSLVSKPKIILLDEPFAAIDPVTVASIQEIIRNLAAEGIAILITDHSVQDTLEITKRSYVIQAGKVLCHGTPNEVLANPEAQKVYFGDKHDRFRMETAGHYGEVPRHHKKHLLPHPVPRSIDPDWIDPDWDISKIEKIEKLLPEPAIQQDHKPIEEKSRPFHLQFHTPPSLDTLPLDTLPFNASSMEPMPTELPEIPPPSTGEDSDVRLRKRLRPILTSITPDIHPVAEEEEPQGESGMSSIIRNLGQMIWRK